MSQQLILHDIMAEAQDILDRDFNLHGLFVKADGTPRFPACKAELSYSIDGGKTMIYLGEVNVGDVHIDPPALD